MMRNFFQLLETMSITVSVSTTCNMLVVIQVHSSDRLTVEQLEIDKSY